MKRLLCIVSSMNRGGAETFLMKVYRSIDKTKYQMDFCVNSSGVYDDEIKRMGGKLFIIPPKSKNFLKNFQLIKKIVKDNKYNYVLRTSQQSLATLDLLAAKFGGANKLIYRSSNAGMTGNILKKILNKMFSFLPRVIPNVKIAPSKKAAEFVFGKRLVKREKVLILKNGLDYNEFKFNKQVRNEMREKLGIGKDVLLFGHIGRFNIQKNHVFLINLFKKINSLNNNTKLLLIGDGEEKEKIKQMVNDYYLNDKVIFLESQNNIQRYLMAMDCLLFPSFFEGMPNVIIEAQASGLNCVISDRITSEVKITNLIKMVSIENIEEWVNVINNIEYKRINTYSYFRINGYLISDVKNMFVLNAFK